MMPKYRIKPAVVEARQVMDTTKVHVLEGEQMARPGSWIVTHPSGLQRVVPNHLFGELYEEVKEPKPKPTFSGIPEPLPSSPTPKTPVPVGPRAPHKKSTKKVTRR
jgi:hypothetical protein